MKEVSCKVFGVKLRALKKRGIGVEALLDGVRVPAEIIESPEEWIDWDTYRAIMLNAAGIWSDDELRDLGAAFFRSPIMKPIALIARILFDARGLYLWLGKGPGKIMFTCIDNRTRELEDGRIQMRLELREGYEPCREFFVLTHGSLIAMPLALSLPPAAVVMESDTRGATYTITLPKGGGLLGRLRRWLLLPFTIRATATELQRANVSLRRRYEELESAQAQLKLQARQLGAAHTISQLIHAELDLEKTVEAIVRALVESGAFTRARIVLSTSWDGHRFELVKEAGGSGPSGDELTSELVSGTVDIGVLSVGVGRDSARDEASQLLEFVRPSISLALHDALSFTALSDYRKNLERRVEERTAELTTAKNDLQDTVARLQSAQQVRDRFFANINHEIRTPLSLVLLAAAEIRRRDADHLNERSLLSIDNIERAVERLLGLVDSLLLLASSQEGKLQIRPQERDLAVDIRQLVAMWTPAAAENRLKLGYSGPDHLAVKLDGQAIERALSNLLSNAVKFTPNGGSIDVQLTGGDDHVEIVVRDTGIGIDEEFKDRIFGRFEQGRPPVRRGAAGSGIGLSIVKELVQAHGGSVRVTDNTGGGTMFTLRVPRRIEGQPGGRALAVGVQQPSLRLLSKDVSDAEVFHPRVTARGTVLVAEDDDALRDQIVELLRDEHKVVAAPDGLTALRLAREHVPDLLVSDIGMPGMDGLELLRRFRALPTSGLAPVILLTAFGQVRDRLAGFDAGAVDYVTKPFEARELVARVRSQLELRSLALRLSRSEKLASLGVLSAGLAHELRNPANALVNAIDPLLELLPEAIKDGQSDAGQLLEVMRHCAEQIGRLSKQLLGFTGGGDVQLGEARVDTLVNRALAILEPSVRQVTTRVELDYDGVIHCAAPMVVQVLVNLIENAAHAAGPGGWLELRSRLEGRNLVLEVSDSGGGVPPELRERVFEPFFTTKPPGQGTGLGLSTSRQIVEQHHGTMKITDGPAGTVFRIELPTHGQRHPQQRQAAS